MDGIAKLEWEAKLSFDKYDLKSFLKSLETDRSMLIKTFEKQIERVKKGAVYFIGMALWGYESVDGLKYPINPILKLFK